MYYYCTFFFFTLQYILEIFSYQFIQRYFIILYWDTVLHYVDVPLFLYSVPY